MMQRVVRPEVQILVGVGSFPEDASFQYTIFASSYAHMKTRQGVVFFHFHGEFDGTCGIYLVQAIGEVI